MRYTMNKKQKKELARILTAAAMMIAMHFAPVSGLWRLAFYLVPYGIISYDILYKAMRGIRNRQVFDENFLMSIASIGAFLLAVYDGSGDYAEAVAVMLFYKVGELFESYAVGRSRRNISELMDIRPDYANIQQEDGSLARVAPDEVSIGSVIVVQPGEKVPLDGVVLEGRSAINSVALTGESRPRNIEKGQDIVSGCINMTGLLKVRTTKVFEESTVSRILELVEEAGSRKSKSEAFIAKFARIYTPIVCYSAFGLAVLPPLVNAFALGTEAAWHVWIYRALLFLVISCPCALVISVPLSFFAGIGGASRAGILIKGSNYLETLSKVRYVVFDKTGTLTHGVFAVRAVHHNTLAEEKLLEYAALAECASSHPVSRSLQAAYGKPVDRNRVRDVQEISGHGIVASVDGIRVAVGNDKLMDRLGIGFTPCHDSGTIVHVGMDGRYAGHIVIDDEIKEQSAAAIRALKKAGIARTVLLTGDNRLTAEQIAERLGIDEVHSELLPADKVAQVEILLKKKKDKDRLAFVGDGINDAPVLTRADVGIAMGAMGSDAAIEAADVVLMDDNPEQVAKAIRIARKCMGIVYQNIVLALGIKFTCLALGAVGIASMWLAIFADVGVLVLAVLNAVRALQVQNV